MAIYYAQVYCTKHSYLYRRLVQHYYLTVFDGVEMTVRRCPLIQRDVTSAQLLRLLRDRLQLMSIGRRRRQLSCVCVCGRKLTSDWPVTDRPITSQCVSLLEQQFAADAGRTWGHGVEGLAGRNDGVIGRCLGVPVWNVCPQTAVMTRVLVYRLDTSWPTRQFVDECSQLPLCWHAQFTKYKHEQRNKFTDYQLQNTTI